MFQVNIIEGTRQIDSVTLEEGVLNIFSLK